SNQFTYAAMRVWLGRELDEADPAESLTWLAGEYMKAFGPATVADFAWWAGVPTAHAAGAIAAHDLADLGDGLLMWSKDVKAFGGTRPVANRVNLLPAWDAYTMGYAEPSRNRFADPELLPYLYDKGGNAASTILIEAEVAGLWDYAASDRKIDIRIGLFEDPGPRAMAAIESEAGLVASYFHARDTTIHRVKIRSPISAGQGTFLKPLAVRQAKRPVVAKSPAKPTPGQPAARKGPKR
ncbi:MAG: DNA glycosylase AlkZ-like family protein, partial [Actinomycetota bacterium]